MRYIRTSLEAEANAVRQMKELGFGDAALTPDGADNGIDVISAGAIAQVKWTGAAVGRPELQKLFGARGNARHLQLFFFAASGYSLPAIRFADEVGIHLFTFDPDGTIQPQNSLARSSFSERIALQEQQQLERRRHELAQIEAQRREIERLEASSRNRQQDPPVRNQPQNDRIRQPSNLASVSSAGPTSRTPRSMIVRQRLGLSLWIATLVVAISGLIFFLPVVFVGPFTGSTGTVGWILPEIFCIAATAGFVVVLRLSVRGIKVSRWKLEEMQAGPSPMFPKRAPTLGKSRAHRLLMLVSNILVANEAVWVVAKAHQSNPSLNGFAVTNLRIIAFDIRRITADGPAVAISGGDIGRIVVEKRGRMFELFGIVLSGERKSFGKFDRHDIDFVCHYARHINKLSSQAGAD
ncbi:restriction endonuclease [Nocardia suismassiliense]|uniref:Restriction endonuclease n=1 Tax=Nocardia suismassiliense TaxID=2077092 RepID=A0ABW6QQU1_9NOCA